MGLANGPIGTFNVIIMLPDWRTSGPTDLPLAVMVTFDKYCGPTLWGAVCVKTEQ